VVRSASVEEAGSGRGVDTVGGEGFELRDAGDDKAIVDVGGADAVGDQLARAVGGVDLVDVVADGPEPAALDQQDAQARQPVRAGDLRATARSIGPVPSML
jgi:hypothetical protein